MSACPDHGAEFELTESRFFEELATDRLLVGLVVLDPTPRGRPDEPIAKVEADEESAIFFVDDDRAGCRTKPKLTHDTSCRSARNHRRRSSHGTAAFAGDVDGSTKSAVSSNVSSCGPCPTGPPKMPVYATFPTPDRHRPQRPGDVFEPLSGAGEIRLA